MTWIQAMTSGSSPHTRGLHVPERGGHYEDGIIPAHAGFTSRFASARTTSRDHPRTRGVYDAQSLVQEGDIGSSPHTRGLLYAASGEITGPRIIPAHAGFTSQGGPRAREPPDHPRTRGVYFPPRDRSIPRVGSSPHTRGLRVDPGAQGIRPGIIPAHAGFTPASHVLPADTADHPRTRGVYRTRARGNRRHEGSSPHTRGLQRGETTRRPRTRIIPAHAGFTLGVCFGWLGLADHPRTRGVY